MNAEAVVKELMNRNVLPTPEMLEEIKGVQSEVDAESLIQKYTSKGTKSNVQVIQSYEEHVKKREISDFVMHYNNRFKYLSGILKTRDIDGLTSIRRIQDMKKEDVATIGMIFDISETKNGHLMIDLEDKTGKVRALITKDKANLFELGKNLVHDEVIAVVGRTGDNDPKNAIVFVNEVYMPDIPRDKVIKKSPVEEYAVFTSDVEVGSKIFLKDEWENFIDWLNGKNVDPKHKEVVAKVKYLVICGDTISGVGIFPGQEHELAMKSVKQQYVEFARYLKMIPSHIQIILCPGNHDAVRLAEPQPAFNPTFAQPVLDLPNVTAISSPGMVNIGKTDTFEGFNVMLYHGFSMPYYGDKVPEIREAGGLSNAAEKVLKFYLQRRHFAPAHGSTQFVPDIRSDPLVIEKVPDFLVTGHIHKIIATNYRGVTMLNTSAWVQPSEYQGRFGLEPDNCRVVLVNLQSRDLEILNFEK